MGVRNDVILTVPTLILPKCAFNKFILSLNFFFFNLTRFFSLEKLA